MSSFAFTGPAVVNGSHLERKYLIALAKEKGHTVVAKVDNKTDFLVCDITEYDPKSPTKKYKNYTATTNVHTLRISSKQFLRRMEFL